MLCITLIRIAPFKSVLRRHKLHPEGLPLYNDLSKQWLCREAERWWILDAEGEQLPRIASVAGQYITGQHRPDFTPGMLTGDHVIIVNIKNAVMTGDSWIRVPITWQTAYPGGKYRVRLSEVYERDPCMIMWWFLKDEINRHFTYRDGNTEIRRFKNGGVRISLWLNLFSTLFLVSDVLLVVEKNLSSGLDSKFYRRNITKDVGLILQEWKAFATATPKATRTSGILTLLKETIEITSSRTLSEVESNSNHARMTLSTLARADATKSFVADTPGDILLGTPSNSILIWKTLQQYRVPFKKTSALVPLQLSVMLEHQQDYIQQQTKSRPWSYSSIILESWNIMSPDLSHLFRCLMQCSTVVSFTQKVSMALRSRPQLHQVLPIPSKVLQHLYWLSLASPPTPHEHPLKRCLPSVSHDALLALNLCRQLALVGSETLSLSMRERLVLDYAHLQARSGNWNNAISVLSSSSVIRFSLKIEFTKYVRARFLCEDFNLSDKQACEAIALAPHWRQALQVLNRFPDNDNARLSFLSRLDVVRGSSESLSWHECLRIFLEIKPHRQTYSVLRKSVLDRLPYESCKYIVLMAHALQHVGPRMYAGTLIRRLEVLRKKGLWPEAIGLACGAKCYDLALNFIPHLPIPGKYELPLELVSYEKTVLSLKQVCFEATEMLDVCKESKKASKGQLDVSELTYPELLAHALYGEWRSVLLSPTALSVPRLRSLLAAKQITEKELNDVATVECHLFGHDPATELIFSCVSGKNLQYFAKVIPSALNRDLRKKFVAFSSRVRKLSSLSDYDFFLRSSTIIVTVADCDALCDLIVQSIRTKIHQTSYSRETLLLRELARCYAQGRVRLEAFDTYGPALAFLKACIKLNCRPEATTALKAFTSIPSPYLDFSTPALIVGVNALNLLGKWQTVDNIYTRFRRKQCQAVLPTTLSKQSMNFDDSSEDTEQLADAFVRTVYCVPHYIQLKWARRIWREQENKFSILLQELLVGDTRECSRMLHSVVSHLSRQTQPPLSNEKCASSYTVKALVSEKRKLLGASFCTLRTEVSLRRVIRACGKKHVQVTDLDEHGIQRLLKALRGPDAAMAIYELHHNRETIEDHWVVSVMASPGLTAQQLRRLSAVRPYSVLVANASKISLGLLENNLTMALRGLLGVVIITKSSPSRCLVYEALAKLMQRICESQEIVSSSLVASNAQQNQLLSRSIYNHLLEGSSFMKILKHDRQSLTMLLKNPESLSPLLLLGYLHHVFNRFLKRPIKAFFSSYMLKITSEYTHDWMSAIYFFKSIRSPSVQEKWWVMYASRGNADAISCLVTCRRFLHGCPEQVIIWCNEQLRASDKWRLSLRVLETTQSSSLSGREAHILPTDPAVYVLNLCRDLSEKLSSLYVQDQVNTLLDVSETSESLHQTFLSLWSGWDCTRALELLRRAGITPYRPQETDLDQQTKAFEEHGK